MTTLRSGAGLGDEPGVEILDEVEDVGLLDEAHFEVELGELGLAVGALVLVAEAAGDLVVTLEAGDHEKLLELLGRLRERVELAGAEPAGHQVVARALRSALDRGSASRLPRKPRSLEEVADEACTTSCGAL